MARQLGDAEIGRDTLIEYLETRSDFHFELKILKMMRDCGLPCEHGGHYVDPVSQKSREFDIRCRVTDGRCQVQLAVECKNLKKSFPLLVSTLPRTIEESYHDAVVIADPPLETYTILDKTIEEKSLTPRARPVRNEGSRSFYYPGSLVGKSTTQVGLSVGKEPEIIANDSDLYEKWGQCLSSMADLIREMEHIRNARLPGEWLVATAIPILVIPDETLWQVTYAADGTRTDDPRKVRRVSVFTGIDYRLRRQADRFSVSHIEIMTESGLKDFIGNHLSSYQTMRNSFFREVSPERLSSEEPVT